MDAEKSNQSIISVSFVAAGFLVYIVVAVMFETLAGTFGIVARVHNIEVVKHGVPVIAGILTFACLYFNKKVYQLADESVTEVKKVVWPSQKDTTAMTILVCVMVLLTGVGLGVFDYISSQLIKLFLN